MFGRECSGTGQYHDSQILTAIVRYMSNDMREANLDMVHNQVEGSGKPNIAQYHPQATTTLRQLRSWPLRTDTTQFPRTQL